MVEPHRTPRRLLRPPPPAARRRLRVRVESEHAVDVGRGDGRRAAAALILAAAAAAAAASWWHAALEPAQLPLLLVRRVHLDPAHAPRRRGRAG
eukprot:scaffold127632_cov63-Phaeocystis_antarctica.AAC.2